VGENSEVNSIMPLILLTGNHAQECCAKSGNPSSDDYAQCVTANQFFRMTGDIRMGIFLAEEGMMVFLQ
jgi:hypothetical protein